MYDMVAQIEAGGTDGFVVLRSFERIEVREHESGNEGVKTGWE